MNQEKFREGLEESQSVKRSEAAKKVMLSFYEANEKYCEDLYRNYIDNRNKNYSKELTTVTIAQFRKVIGNKAILVCTATEIEKYIFLSQMSQITTILSYSIEGDVYNVSNYKKTQEETQIIVHVHQKDTGAYHALNTTTKALSVFRPKVFLLLGVCYGMDIDKQKLAEVCIADRVDCYRLDIRDKKIDPHYEEDHRPNAKFINTIINSIAWYSPQHSSSVPRCTLSRHGRFISTNSLISNTDAKAHIIQECGQPKPIAGEMEAYGALAANKLIPPRSDREYKVRKWLVIKSICDWGEMKNDLSQNKKKNEKIKDSIQLIAMMNSWDFFLFMLKRNLL